MNIFENDLECPKTSCKGVLVPVQGEKHLKEIKSGDTLHFQCLRCQEVHEMEFKGVVSVYIPYPEQQYKA